MPTALMVISPSRTSSISCLNCAILCKLPHRDVNNTEPQKRTVRTDYKKKGQSFFLGASILSGSTNNIGTSGLPQMVGLILLVIDMTFPLILNS